MWQWTFPMAGMVFYMWAVALWSFRSRVKSARKGEVALDYFKTFDTQSFKPPEYMIRVGRHYDNLFQLPVLFLVTGVLAIHMQMYDLLSMICAWGFVISRLAHGLVHLGTNEIPKRAFAFAVGWLFVLILWLLIFLRTMPMS